MMSEPQERADVPLHALHVGGGKGPEEEDQLGSVAGRSDIAVGCTRKLKDAPRVFHAKKRLVPRVRPSKLGRHQQGHAHDQQHRDTRTGQALALALASLVGEDYQRRDRT